MSDPAGETQSNQSSTGTGLLPGIGEYNPGKGSISGSSRASITSDCQGRRYTSPGWPGWPLWCGVVSVVHPFFQFQARYAAVGKNYVSMIIDFASFVYILKKAQCVDVRMVLGFKSSVNGFLHDFIRVCFLFWRYDTFK